MLPPLPPLLPHVDSPPHLSPLHSEQSRCRFCNASLPDFKDALREGLPSPATPVMSVHFNNEVSVEGLLVGPALPRHSRHECALQQ